jgi:hypothetical protein
MVNLNVRLDESEHQRLIQTCSGRGCDKSTVVREALRAYLGGGNVERSPLANNPQAIQAPNQVIHADIWHGIPKARIRGVVE